MSAPFIVLEGPEGAGKSHQASLLAAWLREQGWQVVQTREPGGTAAGNAIRAILLQSDDLQLKPETEALLLTASRAQNVRELIRPSLQAGKAVVCDRFVDSTYAYQGGGSEISLVKLEPLQDFALDGVEPNIRLLLDLPVDIGLERRHGDGAQLNRIDRAPVEFHERVRAKYLQLAADNPEHWDVIDASQSIEAVTEKILDVVQRRLASFSQAIES